MSGEARVIGNEDIRQTARRAVAECRAHCLERLAGAASDARAAVYRRLWDERWPQLKARALEEFRQRNPMAARFTDVLAELGRVLEVEAQTRGRRLA